MVYLWSCILIIIFISLILNPDIALQSFSKSYRLITDVLLPSVFPFMIITQVVIYTKIKNVISYPVKIFFYLIKVPVKMAPYFLCSVLGGYPTGIKALAAGKNSNDITTNEAEQYLPFLINAGPGFVIIAVGKLMFSSVSLGIIFYISQIAASLLVGKIFLNRNIPGKRKEEKILSFQDALIYSVIDAEDSMIKICGFVMLFSLINSTVFYFFGNGLVTSLITSAMEVTNGCSIVSSLENGFLLASFLITFSGISCIYQIKSIGKKEGIGTDKIFIFKFLEGIVALLCTFICVKFIPFTEYTAAINTPPISFYSPDRILENILIGIMFSRVILKADFGMD